MDIARCSIPTVEVTPNTGNNQRTADGCFDEHKPIDNVAEQAHYAGAKDYCVDNNYQHSSLLHFHPGSFLL